jgi:hypothetical protein
VNITVKVSASMSRMCVLLWLAAAAAAAAAVVIIELIVCCVFRCSYSAAAGMCAAATCLQQLLETFFVGRVMARFSVCCVLQM